jgi:MFS family permease
LAQDKTPSAWIWPAAAVAICALLTAVMRVSFDSFAVFLLPLADDFGWDRAETAGIYGCMMLFFGIGCPIAGRMMDRFGPRWTYVIGAMIIAAAFQLTAKADALWQFYLGIGVAVGLGGALIGVVSHATLLARWFRANLTIAIATAAAASGVGMLIFAPLIQLLIQGEGWRAAYAALSMASAILAVVLLVLPWRRLSGPAVPTKARAASQVTPTPAAGPKVSPYRHVGFWALFGIQFLTAFSMFTLNPQIVAFLVEQGFEPLAAASAFGATGLAGTIGLIVFAWVADRRGRGLAMTISYSMTMIGFSLLLAIMALPVWWLVGMFVVIYGPTFGSRGPIVNALVPRLFGRGPGLGLIMGSVHLGMGAGAALGATLGGYLHDVSGYEVVIAVSIAGNAAALTLYWSVGAIRRA